MSVTRLPQENYASIRNLFDTNYPNLPFVFAVIEGRMPGEILVDDEAYPNVCLVTSGGPYCFIAGKLTTAIFIQFLNLLKDKPLVKLVCPISKFENEVQLTNFGFENTPRLQYECKKNIDLVPYYENSSEYDLVAVKDKNIFASCSWAPLMISFYSDCEEYIKNGVALILYDKKMNCVASEAHGVVAEGMIEIGTATHENYRGKKLSTIVCNQLIRDSIKKGLHPIWTCDKANIASRKVAEHQGMEITIEYTFYTLKK